MRGEFHLIERLKSLIPRSLQGSIPIGDDAGVLPADRGQSFLFTTDVIVEGVDFRIGKGGAKPEAIGHKALAVNLSDIAAMGGTPLAFVAAFGIPPQFSEPWVERVSRGILHLARRFNVSWVGGDLSRANRFFISIALWGKAETKKLALRKGARPGDGIYVTGNLGGSIQGKHLTFLPRLREARFLVERFHPTAMIDLSDGFIQDLEQVLVSSRVGARIELDQIPISEAAWKRARTSRRRALKSALTDGEDFELLWTLPRKEGVRLNRAWPKQFPALRVTKVGEIVSRAPGRIDWQEKGRALRRLWFQKKGFVHF